jgi:hypothetical protein
VTLPVDGLDEQERRVVENVERYGSHVVWVTPRPGVDDGFSFTIGLLHNFDHPELIVFGQKATWQLALLNALREEIRAGRRFAPGETCERVLPNYTLAFRTVPPELVEEHFGWALWFYRNLDRVHLPLRALQVVWPDMQGYLPWEPGYYEFYRQPVLDGTPLVEPRNAFPVGLYSLVSVCSVVSDGADVLFVARHDDGTWSFLCGGKHEEDGLAASGDHAHTYCIRDLLKVDETLNEVADLGLNEEAFRDERGGAWTREHAPE